MTILPRIRELLATNLKARMVGAFFTVSAVIGIVLSIVVYNEAASALRESVADRLRGLSIRRVADVDRWVQQHREVLNFVSRLPAFAADVQRVADSSVSNPTAARGARLHIEHVLRSASDGLAVDEVMVLSTKGGRVIASTDSSHVGAFHVDDPFFTHGLDAPYIQNIYPSGSTGRPTLTVSTPVNDAKGRPLGVLAAHLTLKRMDEMLTQSNPNLRVNVYLVNRFGEIVSSERFGREGYRRGVRSDGISRALSGVSGVDEYEDYRGESVIGAFRWMSDRELALMVEVPKSAAFEPARRLLFHLLLIGALGILALTGAVYAVTSRVAQPILATAQAVERVAGGDFNVVAPVTTTDEVGRLATSFNVMTERLRNLYEDLQGQVHATSTALSALRENQALVHGIVDNSPTIVLVMERSGKCILVNTRFEELSGHSRAHATGRHISELFTPRTAEICTESARLVLERGTMVQREITLQTVAGQRTFLAACFPVGTQHGSEPVLGFVATDLTERKNAEEERRAFEANVQHAQKLESLGVMAGGIAHDFNNLLGAVLGNADLALKSLDRRDEVAHSLEQVTVAARRASELTRQMLAYAGRASFRREPVDVNGLVREISSLAAVSFSKKIFLQLRLSETPLSVLADSAQLSQVILNLLTNAGDAIGDAAGNITVHTAVMHGLPPAFEKELPVETPRGGPFALVTVEDNGCGMDETTRRRIFEPFFTSKQMGRGLGLSAVRGIMKGVGGAIVVQSAPGEGTRFDLVFPASTGEIRRPTPIRPAPPTPEQHASTVLVVDDEQLMRYVTRRYLTGAGYRVLEASDGHEAVEIFNANRTAIDAVVLDYTMPGMNGEEVLEAIRGVDRDVGVVMASGYALQQEGERLRADPRVRLLQKPFDNDALFSTIGDLVKA